MLGETKFQGCRGKIRNRHGVEISRTARAGMKMAIQIDISEPERQIQSPWMAGRRSHQHNKPVQLPVQSRLAHAAQV